MGLFVQTLSFTFITPLWLVLHLLTSPIAKLSPSSQVPASSVLVDLWQLAVLPLTVTFTFLTPTLGMILPPSRTSALWHYGAIVVWQPFPLWHSIFQSIFSFVARLADKAPASVDGAGRPTTSPRAYTEQVKGIYSFITVMAVVVQVSILQLLLAPSSVKTALVEASPGFEPYTRPSVTLQSVFAPHDPFSPPTVDPNSLESGDLAPLAIHFLHYDTYVGGAAMLLWALYLYRNAIPKTSTLGLTAKVAWCFLIGGFAGTISTLLSERDKIVETSTEVGKKTK
jgi:hypothetical protein